jgi:hypothetical protein
MKNTAIALMIATLLSACGGNDSSTGSQPVSAQSKQLQRSDKAVASDYETLVQELYVAYFGRPADPTGLVNLENALLAANAPTDIQSLSAAYATNPAIQSLINSFGASAESIALYGTGNPTAFVTAIFQNVLGRAPQQSGLTYWVNAITSGQLSQGDAALAIMAGALSNTTAQGVLDAELIQNRLTVAGYFTSQVSSQNAVSDYAGATAAAGARTMLSGVSAVTNATTLETTAGAVVAALTVPMLAVLSGNMNGPGSVDGTGTAARFSEPAGVTTDSAGNIYVADYGNNNIRKITPAGVVTTLAGMAGVEGDADGTGMAATFDGLNGIATDSAGNVYVADVANENIRKITPDGMVTTLAGLAGISGIADGIGAAASFVSPSGIATDNAGNVYVADARTDIISKITPAGVVTTLAGQVNVVGSTDGTGTTASFNQPYGIAVDSENNIYVADTYNHTIRKITPDGMVTTLAGLAGISGSADGIGAAASFVSPSGIATDNAGNVYVTDVANENIRKIALAGVVTTLAGTAGVTGNTDGAGGAASFSSPRGVAADNAGNVYVADFGNSAVRKITARGVVTTFAGGSAPVTGSADGTVTAASFNGPRGVAADSAGNVYVADYLNGTIRKITPAGMVTTLAGQVNVVGSTDGTGAAANFGNLFGISADRAGNVYVTDSTTIRKVTPAGVVTTLAGLADATGNADGTGAAARFYFPFDVSVDSTGNVYVADTFNNTIRKITPVGVVTTLAGTAGVKGSADKTGAAASFLNPFGIATDGTGNVYVADTGNNTIRKITSAGVVTTLAGKAGVTGSVDGTGVAASFNSPEAITVDSAGNVYVADTGNSTVRKITPGGVVTTVVGVPEQAGFAAGALPGILSKPYGLAISGTSLYISTGNGIAEVNNVP